MNQQIAVLYAREDSVYKGIPGCDVYDKSRDARTFTGTCPVIAHPPCGQWGRLRAFAKPNLDEKHLAIEAVATVRRNGGVLEHPAGSSLWDACCLPRIGESDAYGGYTYPIYQSWFGHKAPKNTWLYIVGIRPVDLPSFPFHLGQATGRISNNGSVKFREHTPPALAHWLVEVAKRIH